MVAYVWVREHVFLGKERNVKEIGKSFPRSSIEKGSKKEKKDILS